LAQLVSQSLARKRLQEIRNCIVHADGWITDNFVGRLRKVGISVRPDTSLKLPKDYFENAWSLVNTTYRAVYKDCWAKFGYEKQNDVWLRPKRQFNSPELRQILKEATDAGIAARERTTKKLLKLASKKGRDDEDSCGWVWLTINPKLLKHIHKLNIANVSTSYNTTAIVDEFRLHLNDVENYSRMSASLDGIEAAAAVLRTYGINSHVHSMAD
jgi:hypothetical protein